MRMFSAPHLPHRPAAYLHEDGALTGCLILVSLMHRLFLNLLPVSFQFPISSFGLQGGNKETSELPSLPAHFS